ncbi:unnamed protein product [Lepidochelys kempii]
MGGGGFEFPNIAVPMASLHGNTLILCRIKDPLEGNLYRKASKLGGGEQSKPLGGVGAKREALKCASLLHGSASSSWFHISLVLKSTNRQESLPAEKPISALLIAGIRQLILSSATAVSSCYRTAPVR